MGGGEKTERATDKRRRDERKKGNVFSSNEINILVSLLAVAFAVQLAGPLILGALTRGIGRFWGEAAVVGALGTGELRAAFLRCLAMYAAAALPALLAAGLAAVITTFAQTRALISGEKLKPKFSNLSPLKGLKKMLSVRGFVELLKSLLKVAILSYVVYNQFTTRFSQLPRLMEMEFTQAAFYCADFLMSIVTSACLIFAFLAAADYLYQRWQYEKDLRMSKHEIKEEYKQLEGDPKIKGRIRQKQREMSMGRMMQQVPQADVVIRNPTHYAVALRYEAGKNRSPEVLAKGADLVALRIVKTAEAAGVICLENRPLARGLYEGVPLNAEIPEEFFKPVAEVLAFVYETGKKYKLPKTKPH